MKHDEFIGQVQTRAHLAGRGDAERATRATLQTLGERIPEGLVNNLAGQLPPEIAENLERTVMFGGRGTGAQFDRQEFIDRVSERTGADEPAAVYQARVVLEVTEEAVEGKVMERVRESLPADLVDFTTGSQGQLGD